MRDVTSSQRRRRLRIIKILDERSSTQTDTAAPELEIHSTSDAAQNDIETLQRKLLVECRANLSTLLRVDHPSALSMNVVMDRPYLVIGSDPACDLRLDHEDVKPRHCLLQWIDGHLFCCDIGTRMSLVPGRESPSNCRWLDHEPIAIGPYRLTRCDEEAPVHPEFSPLDRSPRLATEYPLLALQFDGVEQTENVWPINRTLTLIGRGSQCKLRLNHKKIAEVHACLLRTSTGCWLIDLANEKTTAVNGKAIEIASLDIGDQLQIGTFKVEVVTMDILSAVIIPSARLPQVHAPIGFDRPASNNLSESKRNPAVDRFHPVYKPSSGIDDSSVKTGSATMDMPSLPRNIERSNCDERFVTTIHFDSPPVYRSESEATHSTNQSEQMETEVKSVLNTISEVPVQEDEPISTIRNGEFAELSSEKEELQNVTTSDKSPMIQEKCESTGNSCQEPDTPPTLVESPSDLKNPVASAITESTSQFIMEQQSQLAMLKQRLDALKVIYDDAAGRMISTRLRNSLEQPVIETFQCLELMKATLDEFVQKIERPSA